MYQQPTTRHTQVILQDAGCGHHGSTQVLYDLIALVWMCAVSQDAHRSQRVSALVIPRFKVPRRCQTSRDEDLPDRCYVLGTLCSMPSVDYARRIH